MVRPINVRAWCFSRRNQVNDPNVVAVYSAANNLDAYALAGALEAAGIEAKVVGEFLNMAAGGLPLGQPIAPSVWVRKEDEARARQFLEEHQSRAAEPPEAIESPESEAEEPSDEAAEETAEELPSPEGPSRGFLSPLLVVVGIAAMALGAYYAIENHILLACYPETTQARFIGTTSINAANNTQIQRNRYEYEVGGAAYYAAIDKGDYRRENITIRYNPQDPADNHADSILHPAWCLFLGGAFGAFALFLANQFRASA
jgi:hypothetical protein